MTITVFGVLPGPNTKKSYVYWNVLALPSSLLSPTTAEPLPPHNVNWVNSGARTCRPGMPTAYSALLEPQPACSDLCKPQCVASLWCCCWLQRKRAERYRRGKRSCGVLRAVIFSFVILSVKLLFVFHWGLWLLPSRTRLKPVVKWGNLTSLFCLPGKAARSG